MDLIRKYLVQIKAQLAGLTISQKLLIGLLTIVMIATIFFTVVFSAKPAMVPLIPQAMTPEEINQVKMIIEGHYEYQLAGDKILVPAEQAYAIRGELSSKQALPKNMVTAFTNMINSASQFNSEKMNERAWNNALQEELSRVLSNYPYLDEGLVIIAHGEAPGIGKPAMPSTATVSVRVKGAGLLTNMQVNAIAELVRGSVPGMAREQVHITDGQRAYYARSASEIIPENVREVKKAMEDDIAQKLFIMFEHFGDVKIAVNVEPDFSVRTREEDSYNPKTTLVRPLNETSREMNSTLGNTQAEGQPGVVPNTGMTADSGSSSRKQSSSTVDTSTTNVVGMGHTHENTSLPSGVEIKHKSASLSLPRSYFVKLYQRELHDAKADPEDEKLQPYLTKIIKDVQATAMNVLGATTDQQVRVDWYDDMILSNGAQLALASTGFPAGSFTGVVSQYAKQGVLAVVALGALGMMLMMVRRAVPAGDVDVDTGVFFGGGKRKRRGKKDEEVDQFDGDDVFGEANEGNAVLTGIELDDETLQSRKMVDEVSTMIKENPENAAALVKRWMAKSK